MSCRQIHFVKAVLFKIIRSFSTITGLCSLLSSPSGIRFWAFLSASFRTIPTKALTSFLPIPHCCLSNISYIFVSFSSSISPSSSPSLAISSSLLLSSTSPPSSLLSSASPSLFSASPFLSSSFPISSLPSLFSSPFLSCHCPFVFELLFRPVPCQHLVDRLDAPISRIACFCLRWLVDWSCEPVARSVP